MEKKKNIEVVAYKKVNFEKGKTNKLRHAEDINKADAEVIRNKKKAQKIKTKKKSKETSKKKRKIITLYQTYHIEISRSVELGLSGETKSAEHISEEHKLLILSVFFVF